MITFGAMLDASQNAHRCVGQKIIIKLNCVQILHRNPAKNGARLLDIRHTCCGQLAHKIGECLLIFSGDLKSRNLVSINKPKAKAYIDGNLVEFGKDIGIVVDVHLRQCRHRRRRRPHRVRGDGWVSTVRGRTRRRFAVRAILRL